MPIFTRRRLQSMLNDISLLTEEEKARDLIQRLEKKDVDQVLPAEMELALLWALSQIGEVDIEPIWWGDNHRPDAYTEALIPGEPAVVEIAATSDNRISGQKAMDSIALQISDFASTVRRRLGDFLYYRFSETSGYKDGRYFRHRLAPRDYKLSDNAKSRIRAWIESGDVDGTSIRIRDDGLDVTVERKAHKQIRFHNTHSSMPPEAHSIDENPLFELLDRKLDQLKAATSQTRRVIFLCDVGSRLMNQIGKFGEFDSTRRRISGTSIISHFVHARQDRIDSVVTFSPVRELEREIVGKKIWKISVFNRPGYEMQMAGLEQIRALLPMPRFEGYQARSLVQQGAFSPKSRAWSRALTFEWKKGGPVKIKVSARTLVDVLAGRITPDQFRSAMGERDGDTNIIKHHLDRGYTLQGVEFESGGLDQDDDTLVLTLSDDPAARPLKMMKRPAGA